MTGTGIDYATSNVILVGTSRYDDAEFPAVPAVEHSLRDMHATLTEPALGGWPADKVACWLNHADCRAVGQAFQAVAEETTGTLIFYFAGHGTISRYGDLFLVLLDTPASHADIYGLPIETIRRAFSQSRATAKIMILDCCYSGRAIDEVLSSSTVEAATQLKGAYVLTASNKIVERARWSGNGTEPTSFTRELLEIMRTGLPIEKTFLGLDDIYPELLARLQVRDLPEPSSAGVNWGGESAFTLNAWRLGTAHGNGSPAIPPTAPPRQGPRPQTPRRPGQGGPQREATRISRRTFLTATGGLLVGAAAGVGATALIRQPDHQPGGSPVVPLTPIGTPLGGSDEIWDVATGTLGTRPVAVSSAGDGTIIVWDLVTRVSMGKPIKVGSGVQSLALTTVGGRPVAVSGSDDGRVRVWDLTTRAEIGPALPHLHTAKIWRVATTVADGTVYAVSSGDDGYTWVWDITRHASLDRLPYVPATPKDTSKVFGLAAMTLTDSTPVAITGGDDRTVRLWNLTSNEQSGPPMTSDGLTTVRAIAVGTLNGKPIALSGQVFGDVRIWDLTTHAQMGAQLGRHGDWAAGQGQPVWGIALGQREGHVIAVSVGDGTPLAFDLTRGGLSLTTLAPQDNSVWGIALAEVNGDPVAVTGCLDGRVGLYNLAQT
jgi:WD40 repeat protein